MGVIYNYLLKKVPRKVLETPVLVNIQNVVDYLMEADEYAVKEADMNISPPWNYALFEWDVEYPLLMAENPGEYFTHHGMLIDFFKQEKEAGLSTLASTLLPSLRTSSMSIFATTVKLMSLASPEICIARTVLASRTMKL